MPVGTVAWEWQATGTTWRIHHDGRVDEELARRAVALVEADEARWSRFRPDSEVSRIGECSGAWVDVSAETVELLDLSLDWMVKTYGTFHPLVGRALHDWGYAEGMQHAAPAARRSPAPQRVTARLDLDRTGRRARVTAGALLDLGGIAKGHMADRLARLLAPAGGRILVDAGGDLVAAAGSHVVGVEGADAIAIEAGQAIATSSTRVRRWRNDDGIDANHLIDPLTGAPLADGTATVVADGCAAADVLAKTLALRPLSLGSFSGPARAVIGDRVRTNAAWDAASLGALAA